MKKFNWLIFTFLAFAIFACDDEDAVLDTENPAITITSPTSNQQFNNDESVLVAATVTDNLGLEEVTISVTTPDGTTRVVHTESVNDFLNDNRKADIEETVALGTGTVAAGNYTIMVRAVDEQGNFDEESVTITVAEADDEAPTITIVSPEAGTTFGLGSDVSIDADIAENMNLSSVNVMVVSGANTTIYDTTVTEFTDPTVLDFTDVVTIPADANVGTYTLSITAEDVAGNELVETRTFDVSEQTGTITFTVTDIPANTPADDTVFIAGEFAAGTWTEPGTDNTFALTKNEDGTWTITLEPAPGDDNVVAFKFFRQGGWGTGEQTAACEPVEDRTVTVGVTGVTGIEIPAWEDLCGQ